MVTATLDDLHVVSAALTSAGIAHALGGSGLMHLLGLAVDVHDWDITTDAPEAPVRAVVERFTHTRLGPAGPFRSRFAYKLAVGNSGVDVIGGFAVHDGQGIVECRTIVTGYSGAVPLGSPAEWARIYRALGEDRKADALLGLGP